MKVTWERTIIAGEAGHEDFLALDERGRRIGRIYRQMGDARARESVTVDFLPVANSRIGELATCGIH